MAVVRLEAFATLKAAIVAAVPELDGHVFIAQAPPNQKACFPALVIEPLRFRYEPRQSDEVFEPAPDRVVMNVGHHVITLRLKLAAASPHARGELQEKLLGLFLGQALRPGILLTTVTACMSLGDFVAAWSITDDEWQDEKVLDVQWWSEIFVVGEIPALVTRGSAHRIEDLRVGITADMTTAFTPATFESSPDVQVVRIEANGSITPA
jgi:hypothetical protein